MFFDRLIAWDDDEVVVLLHAAEGEEEMEFDVLSRISAVAVSVELDNTCWRASIGMRSKGHAVKLIRHRCLD